MRTFLLTLWLAAGWLAAVPAWSSETTAEQQRARFVDARAALRGQRMDEFHSLADSLRDYPLYPYLRFEELLGRLSDSQRREVREFLDTFADTPLAPRLRDAWLYLLAERREWSDFLSFYRAPHVARLQCYRLQALIATRQPWQGEALGMWMSSESQPKACDPAFDALYAGQLITPTLLWQRIGLAMEHGQTRLATYLGQRLPDDQRPLVTLWQTLHQRPASTLQDPALSADSPVTRAMLLHGLRRLSRADTDAAWARWQEIKDRYAFSAADRNGLERDLALRSAYRGLPQAHARLAQLPDGASTEKSRDWRIRTALGEGDWNAVLASIDVLPAEEANEDLWRYWKARALEKLDRRIESMTLYSDLAQERSYHGFLAADYLRQPYAMWERPIEASDAELEALQQRPAFRRAYEFYQLGERYNARREWHAALDELSPRQLELAALLAHRWGWHDRAILTTARAGHFDDLELRFPLVHTDATLRNARAYDIDPALIFGVIRQESAFMEDARSSAGALGLMQLMPATGRTTARRLNIPLPDINQLLEAEYNIRIGSGYLRQVLDRYDGNAVLATAAYNAGPHRVDAWKARWLTDARPMSAELWAELIPFTETRRYVRGVLAYSAVFDWRLKNPVTPLSKRMPPVTPE